MFVNLKPIGRSFLRLIAMALILATALSVLAGCDFESIIFGNISGSLQETGASDTSGSTSEIPATTGTTDTTGTTEVSATPEVSESTQEETQKQPEEPPYDPERITEYALNADSPVFVTGRTVELSEGIALDLSAASMRFRTSRAGDVSLKGVAEGDNELYFTVYVDGVRVCDRVMFPKGESTQVIAKGLSDETHLIEIVRQTEGQYGCFTAEALIMKGSTLGTKPAQRKLYIEFVGDSITCGSGVLCKYITWEDMLTYLPEQTGDCLYDMGYGQWREEDVTNSYAYLTARSLNADCSFISYSAIGLVRSWMNLGFNAQDLYRKGSYLRDGGETYDFSNARKPDFVVVNLGTNDIGLMNGGQGGYVGKLTNEQYKQAVKNFIKQIRDSYNDPNLKVVWAVGLMGDGNYSLARAAILEMDDPNLYYYQFSPAMDGHRDHPCMMQSVDAARALKMFLRREGVVG